MINKILVAMIVIVIAVVGSQTLQAKTSGAIPQTEVTSTTIAPEDQALIDDINATVVEAKQYVAKKQATTTTAKPKQTTTTTLKVPATTITTKSVPLVTRSKVAAA
jgi:hypothetical protein